MKRILSTGVSSVVLVGIMASPAFAHSMSMGGHHHHFLHPFIHPFMMMMS